MQDTGSQRRRLAVAASLTTGLLSWLVVPGSAADFRLDAAGDRYGTIDHGIGGHGSYPIHVPGHHDQDAGTLLMHQVGGGDVEAYCIDLRGVRNPAAVYRDGERRIDQIAYILNHHFPAIRGPGELGDLNREAAAVQLAVWAFSDGVDPGRLSAPSVPDFGTVVARARQIAGEAAAGWQAWAGRQTLPPAVAMSSGPPVVAPGSAPVTATVAGAADGTPVIFTITSGPGSLSGARSAAVPLQSGAATVPVTSASPGPVTVAAEITVPGLAHLQLNPDLQPGQTLVLASQVPVTGRGSQTVTFTGAPRLTLSKSVSDGDRSGTAIEARPGDLLRFTLSYANGGTAPATAAAVSDDLRHGALGLLPGTQLVLEGGESRRLDSVTGEARWVLGDIAPGGSGSVDALARVPASLPDSGRGVDLCNTASISAGESPPVASNSACAHVTTTPHLVTVKTVDAGDARPGQTLRYSIGVTNDGTRDLAAVSVTDSLAAGSLASLTDVVPSNGGGWDPAARTVRWNVASLPAGQSVSVGFSARVPDADLPPGDTCFVNAAVASVGGQPYPAAPVTTCAHASVPSLPRAGSGPVTLVPAPPPGGPPGRPRTLGLRTALPLASVLVAAAIAASGHRRPRRAGYRRLS